MHSKVYIIAEIGINHNGILDNCFKLIDAAADAGCNAAKFQLFKAALLYPKSAGRLQWKGRTGSYSYDIYEAADRFSMPPDWINKIVSHCKYRNIEFLSSVFDKDGLDFLLECGMKKIKLSSYTLTHLPFIEYCARKKLPLIMSTGGAYISEIEEAVNSIRRYNKSLAILHCSLNYPTRIRDCNLGIIDTLRYNFPDSAIGYSDHTAQISAAAKQAVYLGSKIIEKHITLDKRLPGPDHFFALAPSELKLMVRDIRQAEVERIKGSYRVNRLIYGRTSRIIGAKELYLRNFAFMKIFAKHKIPKGKRINLSDLIILRPGNKKNGLEPKYLTLFKDYSITAKRNIVSEEPITWDCILK